MLAKLAINMVSAYQRYFRAGLVTCCRFSPSCSEYAKLAIQKYGFSLGVLKAARRLLHCHPFSGSSGYDPLL